MSLYLENLKSKNIHVLGASGAEGSAIVLFLAKYGAKKVVCHDFCEEKEFRNNFFLFRDALSEAEKEKEFRKIRRTGFKFYFKDKYLHDIEKADVIFVPQSWFRYKFNEKLVKLAGSQKKFLEKLSSITKLYFNLCVAPIIAVTGTSGKSTTTRLVYEIVKKSKNKVYFTGNDRENRQILEQILDITPKDILVMEVSNRQLKIDLGKSPRIGIITNISPNHMDDHKSFNDYVQAKASLLKYQKAPAAAILNYDNEVTRDLGKKIKSLVCYFSTQTELMQGAFLRDQDLIVRDNGHEYKICSIRDLKIPGKHNIENVLAAALAGFLYGINTKNIREAVMNFTGIKSRLQFVRETRGVKYYEDSSACNPDGTRVAVASFIEPKIIIAGGERRTVVRDEFEAMAKAIVKNNVRAMFLIGKKAELIKQKIKEAAIAEHKLGPIMMVCKTLDEAVERAAYAARRGDVVVMSPGCESFDMFADYRDRAKKFHKAVMNLK